jgi:hypothetical protein
MPFYSSKRSFVLAAPHLLRHRKLVAKGRGKRPDHHRKDVAPQVETYQAGDSVRQSGIYETVHEGAHRGPHDVVMIESDLFPVCDTCSDQVRFRLVRSAPYIFTDEDFEKPR